MSNKNYLASSEFQVGKNSIVYVSKTFSDNFGDVKFDERMTPTFKKLTRYMSDQDIETEFRPGICELGHVLAFIKNPPEGTKDGWSNIFYVGAFVVSVFWRGGGWRVDSWRRGGFRWFGGRRVFSPAFGSVSLETKPSDALTLEERILILETWKNRIEESFN